MLNIIVRKSSKPTSGFLARLYKDGHPVMYKSTCPYQGAGKTAEVAVGQLFLGYGKDLELISDLDQSPAAVADPAVFGAALIGSATNTRNFLIQVDSDKFWDTYDA